MSPLDGLSTFLERGRGFPGDSVVKDLPVKAGDVGLIPGLGRFPGEGNGIPLQYSCLRNPMDRGACRQTWGCKRTGPDLGPKQQEEEKTATVLIRTSSLGCQLPEP